MEARSIQQSMEVKIQDIIDWKLKRDGRSKYYSHSQDGHVGIQKTPDGYEMSLSNNRSEYTESYKMRASFDGVF
jgi:predicted transcriptional regulator